MPSPDWTDYVDLTPYDKNATDIFDEAIEYAKDVLPEWTPEAGNIEVVLLEAVATESANVIAAANRVPGSVVETLLKLFGIDRSDGVKATGTIEVTLTTSAGVRTIPAGTNFAYFPPGGGQGLVYTLDADLIIPDEELTGSGLVTAFTYGADYNDPSDGAALQVMSTIPYVLSTVFAVAGAPIGGFDSESDTEYFSRAMTTLRSFSNALVTDDQIQSWILTNYTPAVYRCKVYNRRIADDRDVSTYTTHNGYALAVVAGQNADPADLSDVPLTGEALAEIAADLDELVPVSIIVEVANAELEEVAVAATVTIRSGYNTSDVEEAVSDALDEYLSPNNWEWDEGVRLSSVISVIASVPGVFYVGTLTINSASEDFIFSDLGSLPYPGTHTISAT